MLILPAAETGEGEAWVVVDAADVEITPLDSLDLTRPVAGSSADS